MVEIIIQRSRSSAACGSARRGRGARARWDGVSTLPPCCAFCPSAPRAAARRGRRSPPPSKQARRRRLHGWRRAADGPAAHGAGRQRGSGSGTVTRSWVGERRVGRARPSPKEGSGGPRSRCVWPDSARYCRRAVAGVAGRMLAWCHCSKRARTGARAISAPTRPGRPTATGGRVQQHRRCAAMPVQQWMGSTGGVGGGRVPPNPMAKAGDGGSVDTATEGGAQGSGGASPRR